ncbi:MAG: hypothetical protein HKN35_14515 [Woeseia sp.]|nr:metallophosphoesterase [Woeseia sp.]MBT8096462.1 metallophosphoesterase [Woeseia sp.]NNE62105.1 hypothetical protein [Woeseia sp.]NNL55309.1 hypothetical protein [Woeseia sp.]
MPNRRSLAHTPLPWFQKLLLAAMLLQSACAISDELRHDGVKRVVAISDIHGAYDSMRSTLQRSGIIDAEDHWSGAASHLVVTGDILDRGPASRAALDLLMRLEAEARAAGGQVHVLLGNHEVMNLVGDLRYVSSEEYAAFADDEDAAQRDYWRRQFINRASALSSDAVLTEQFERAHPPGFFAHRKAFSEDGVYGRWLLAKPAVIVLNSTAFVHGGLSPAIVDMGLEGINSHLRTQLNDYVRAVQVLNDAGILQPGDAFYAHRKIVETAVAGQELTGAVQAAVATVLSEPDLRFDSMDSPLWYRGNVSCPPLAETARLLPVLEALGATRVVIGHTPTAPREVVSRLGGRVIEIDTGMLTGYYQGSGHALVLAGDDLAVIAENGERSAISTDPRPLGYNDKPVEVIEDVLLNGVVTLGERRDDGRFPAKAVLDGQFIDGLFLPSRSRRSVPESAAYRLDRMLELQMVPVTVVREVDGKRGTLQMVPLQTLSEAERVAGQLGTGAWCPLPTQWNIMYVFDALILNEVRAQQHMAYSRESWQLFLTNHENAFGTGRGRPRYLKDATLDVNGVWRDALLALDETSMQEQLSDVLDKRQIRALLRRRDQLLKSP